MKTILIKTLVRLALALGEKAIELVADALKKAKEKNK
jgi:hypothetical protein